jgi:hypothetical protein
MIPPGRQALQLLEEVTAAAFGVGKYQGEDPFPLPLKELIRKPI